MIPEKYCFEGEAIAKCSRCGLVHTVSFSDISPATVEQAIESAMELDGWGVASMTCPDCYDPLDEQRARDELLEEDMELDDYEEEYDEYDDE